MEKTGYQEWVRGAAFTCYGVRFSIKVNDPKVAHLLPRHLPLQSRKTQATKTPRRYSIIIRSNSQPSDVSRSHLLYVNSTLLAKSADLHVLLNALETDLQLHVAQMSPRRVFIHSGVVGWKGKAVLIPGASFSGKSCLVAELVRVGAQYYSDEYAVIDQRGRVHPYPKPLHIRNNESGGVMSYTTEDMGGVTGVDPLPVGLVLVSSYQRGATWNPKQVLAGQGLLELLRHTASARSRPQDTLSALQKIVTQSFTLKGVRGEAKDIANALLRQLDSH